MNVTHENKQLGARTRIHLFFKGKYRRSLLFHLPLPPHLRAVLKCVSDKWCWKGKFVSLMGQKNPQGN